MIKFFTAVILGMCLCSITTNGNSETTHTSILSESNSYLTKSNKDNSYDISYTIEPFYDIKLFRFIVVMEFRGEKSGETIIKLPNEYGGSYHLKGIKFLKALSENTYIIETDKPDIKLLKYPSGALVKIYYQVEEIRDDDIELGNHYMAVLNKRYFHLLAETFFILPLWDQYSEFKFRITWNHMPINWNLANSFGVNEKNQLIQSSLSKFSSSIFVGGDFRIQKRTLGNNSIYLAIRNKWKFSDDQLIDFTKEILRVEREFWNDHNFPYFLITVLPISGSGDQVGIARTNSYSLFLSSNREIDYRLKRVIAHESFHTWLGGKMNFAEPEQLVYWFKEGFCDYYTRLLLLRAKLITLEEYIEEYNNILYAYATSPVRYELNDRVIKDFWTDQNIMKLPYMRGDIIAHNLNAIIKKNSNGEKSLDDMMRDLLKRTKNESLIISNGSLGALIRHYAGEQALSEIMKTLNSGAALKVHPDACGPCFKVEIDSFRKYRLIGELYEVPIYKPRNESSVFEKKCLNWFFNQ